MATFAACPASYFFVKISILFFYLRVFQLQARLRYIIYALFFYCFVYYWVAFFTIVGLCNAENRSWDITATMNCFAYGKLTVAIGAMDLVADVLVLAFPVPMVLKLQISRPQKVYLLFVFLAGIRSVHRSAQYCTYIIARHADLYSQRLHSMRNSHRFRRPSQGDGRRHYGSIWHYNHIVSRNFCPTWAFFAPEDPALTLNEL